VTRLEQSFGIASHAFGDAPSTKKQREPCMNS